jgi:hypothetical protein
MSDFTAALITAQQTVTFRTFTQVPPLPGFVTINITLCGIGHPLVPQRAPAQPGRVWP